MTVLELLFVPCILFFHLLHPKMTKAVPPDYCFHQLNKSDCRTDPTPVFSYYHSGSRCELEIWRGCPTYNKFDDEYQCSNTCIFKYRWDSSENKIVNYETKGGKEKLLNVKENPDLGWKNELESLQSNEVEYLDILLDNVLNDLTSTSTSKTNEETEITKKTVLIPETTMELTEKTTVTQITVTEDITTTPVQTTAEITTLTTESTTASPNTVASTTMVSIKTTTEPFITTETVIETTAKEDDLVRPTTKPTTARIETTTKSTTVTDKVTSAEILTAIPTTETTTIATTTITTTTGDPDEVIIV